MNYDYVPLPKRAPLRWPNGARLALIVTINLEYWDLLKESDEPYYAGGPPVIPDPMPGNVPDFPNFSWREYGQRVGVWRMMDTFDAAGVPASCTMNAKMGLERREVIDAVNERGWELVAHNYEQGDLLTNYQFDREAEAKLIRDALKVYEETVGRPARGWLSSSLRSTTQTADILVEEGLSFICDYMNDEQIEHFRQILLNWKLSLMEEVDRTVGHMKSDATNFPDPNDRATQEEEFSLELRTRDRERKLIKKIDESISKLDEDEYGYCDGCGVEIGIRRLEARPTANLCIECKTLEEIREKQIA